jgi:hypothetical protein
LRCRPLEVNLFKAFPMFVHRMDFGHLVGSPRMTGGQERHRKGMRKNMKRLVKGDRTPKKIC